MPMLKVQCKVCGAMIPTGLELDHEAFKDLTFTDRSVECPICESMQAWGIDDVDVSVFKKLRK
jgi:endogenous inhibitor of DNA gyrase (YacG/DUF329 family)